MVIDKDSEPYAAALGMEAVAVRDEWPIAALLVADQDLEHAVCIYPGDSGMSIGEQRPYDSGDAWAGATGQRTRDCDRRMRSRGRTKGTVERHPDNGVESRRSDHARTTSRRDGQGQGATGLTPGHWIAIGTIAVAVLGGVLGWALSEHNARLANVESDIRNIAEAQARTEGEIKAIHERLDSFGERLNRIETGLDRLIQLHLGAETTQPAAARSEQPAS